MRLQAPVDVGAVSLADGSSVQVSPDGTCTIPDNLVLGALANGFVPCMRQTRAVMTDGRAVCPFIFSLNQNANFLSFVV